jgi:hypothetical protein
VEMPNGRWQEVWKLRSLLAVSESGRAENSSGGTILGDRKRIGNLNNLLHEVKHLNPRRSPELGPPDRREQQSLN